VLAAPNLTAGMVRRGKISSLFALRICEEACLHMESLYPTGYLHCNPGHSRGNGFRCLPE
jgi:hypothetical protein